MQSTFYFRNKEFHLLGKEKQFKKKKLSTKLFYLYIISHIAVSSTLCNSLSTKIYFKNYIKANDEIKLEQFKTSKMHENDNITDNNKCRKSCNSL